MIQFSNEASLPTPYGKFKIRSLKDELGKEHMLIYLGDLKDLENVPLRIHSECLTGDVFGSLKCDCGEQLDASMAYIKKEQVGLIIYMRQEGRGIGLFNKIEAYALQDKGMDTIEANQHLGFDIDLRTYELAVDAITYLGIGSVKLLTNNPEKLEALINGNIKVTEKIKLDVQPNPYNESYLETKKIKLNHSL